MKTHKITTTLAALAAMTCVGHADAAVTFVGSIANDTGSQISEWSDDSVAKTLDLDGDNLYGSDGYTWMNTDDADGNPKAVLHSFAESGPSYTDGIVYTGAVSGVSGSFSGADDRRNAGDTANENVGYAGVNYNNTTGATELQELFAYTMNRDMATGETIRVGIVLDSLNDTVIGADSLRVVAGGTADAAGVARSGVMDIYFFDVTGLSNGDEIQIWGAKAADVSNFGYNAITIGGVTFDSVPEPGSLALMGLGGLCILRRRRS